MNTNQTRKLELNNSNIFFFNILKWALNFPNVFYFNSNNYPIKRSIHTKGYKNLLGVSKNINFNNLLTFSEYSSIHKNWFMGFISYDYKNEIERLPKANPNSICFPDIYFIEPEIVFYENDEGIFIETHLDIDDIIQQIKNIDYQNLEENTFIIHPKISKQEYINTILNLKKHIQQGDIYEINFCQEFYAQNAIIDPLQTYWNLNNTSPMPFSSFVKIDNKYLLCASPERFLKKEGDILSSQPIKGTMRRNTTHIEEDNILKNNLLNNTKEKAENVMIVDLVRNDLSKIASKASVHVDELFGIYTFPQVHQMISSISCKIKNDTSFKDIIHATFPMGSMTGAPKVKAMELIHTYEKNSRGLFSGTVGYIDPCGDFDFNVIIRSILYDTTLQYLSYWVGSAITSLSDPEEEYKECLLKAKAIEDVLGRYKRNNHF